MARSGGRLCTGNRPARRDAPNRLCPALGRTSLLGLSVIVLQMPAAASPDGAEWIAAADPMGCMSCHFDSAPPSAEALAIEGLPDRFEPGRTYALTLVLKDPALRNAGFLLRIDAGDESAGNLSAADGDTETQGSLARQTRAGSVAAQRGERRWRLDWKAPAAAAAAITFDLWGNAGNDDLSPFGDAVHHRVWQIAAEP